MTSRLNAKKIECSVGELLPVGREKVEAEDSVRQRGRQGRWTAWVCCLMGRRGAVERTDKEPDKGSNLRAPVRLFVAKSIRRLLGFAAR